MNDITDVGMFPVAPVSHHLYVVAIKFPIKKQTF